MALNEQISQIRRLIQFWFWLCQRNSPFVSYAGLISFAAFLFLFERVFAVNVISLSMRAKSLSKITECQAEVVRTFLLLWRIVC